MISIPLNLPDPDLVEVMTVKLGLFDKEEKEAHSF